MLGEVDSKEAVGDKEADHSMAGGQPLSGGPRLPVVQQPVGQDSWLRAIRASLDDQSGTSWTDTSTH